MYREPNIEKPLFKICKFLNVATKKREVAEYIKVQLFISQLKNG